MLELHRLFPAGRELHAQRVRVLDRREPPQILHLPALGQQPGAAGQPRDDLILERAQLVEIDRRLAECDPPGVRVARFGDEFCDVQECLGRDAAPVDTNAPGIELGIDQRGLEAEIGREKRGGVAARAAPHDDDLNGNHP